MTNLETTGVTISSLLAAVTAADHIIANSKSVLQNSLGPFLWALITRKPWRALKEDNMLDIVGFVTKIKEDLVKVEPMIEECLIGLGRLAKLTEMIAPMCGPDGAAVAAGAKMAEVIDAAAIAALQKTSASGDTHASALAVASEVITAVAASGAVKDQATVAKLNEVAAVVKQAPELYSMP